MCIEKNEKNTEASLLRRRESSIALHATHVNILNPSLLAVFIANSKIRSVVLGILCCTTSGPHCCDGFLMTGTGTKAIVNQEQNPTVRTLPSCSFVNFLGRSLQFAMTTVQKFKNKIVS